MNIKHREPFTIGLTGQSGAGKSYISKYFEKYGFKILNADEYVKRLYKMG